MDTRIVSSRGTDAGAIPVTLEVNGAALSLSVAPYVTLLDLLREQLQLTGTKKGCDHGQCGACTVLVEHDAFQCGYCTPGQICSARALIAEGVAKAVAFTRDEVREYMSGNLCRCGAYPNITDAVMDVLRRQPGPDA
jgi:xanthine dehydrogenase YagT iron-sulfur-binding subunit